MIPYLIIAIRKYIFRQGVKLSPLLQDLGQDFHEGCSGLEIFVIAQADGVHQARVNVCAQEVGHGLDGRVA